MHVGGAEGLRKGATGCLGGCSPGKGWHWIWKVSRQVFSRPQYPAPPRAGRLLPAAEQPESVQRGQGLGTRPLPQSQLSDPGAGQRICAGPQPTLLP